MKLKPILLACLAVLVLPVTSGCNLFRKSKKPKENPAMAAELAASFQERWMEHRTAELTAAGREPAEARRLAESEFQERFPHLVERRN